MKAKSVKTWAVVCTTLCLSSVAQAANSTASCVDLSDAKYGAKALDLTTFEARDPGNNDMTRVIIGLRGDVRGDVNAFNVPGRIIHRLKLINAIAAEVPVGSLERLAKDPHVRYIEHDAKVHTLGMPGSREDVPAPTGQTLPHGISRAGAPEAWSKTTGKGVTVAIIDTGIDATHPDLKGRVIGGKNFTSEDANDWKDGHGHGTHVSGTVAANNDDQGVVGMAPDASLLAVRVLDEYGSGTYADVTAGVEYAVGKAQVANMSLGGTSDSQPLHEALIKAHNNGLIVVAAAGNSGEDYGNPLNYPSAYPETVSTAAVDDNDLRAYFSTYNKYVAIAAHGVSVLSCDKGGQYVKHSGTSMATPHVAGAMALLRQVYKDESVVDLKRRLVCNAEDQWPTGRDQWTGYGIANVPRALANAAPAGCAYLNGPVEEPVIAAPVTKPDPKGDKAVTFVKSTALTMINDGTNPKSLLVTVKLVDEKLKPVAQATVTSDIAERGTGPLGSATATTNANGEAQFVLTGFRCGKFLTRVKATSAANFSADFGQPEAEVDLGNAF